MSNDILKIKIHNEKNYIKDTDEDFGIYTYLSNHSKHKPLNLVAGVFENTYVVITNYSANMFHEELQDVLTEKYGESDFSIRANGYSFAIWDNEELSSIKLDVVLGVIYEIKKFSAKNFIPVLVEISIPGLSNRYDSYFDFDNLIKKLLEKKNENNDVNDKVI